LRRLAGLIWVVFGIVLLTFLLMHLVPGDPVSVMLGESASGADRVALRQALGLDQPLHLQFLGYMQRLMHGDLGYALHSRTPIASLLLSHFPATLQLALCALAIAMALGIPLGVLAALHYRAWPDHISTLFSLMLAAMPHFWLGPLLMLVFALWLGWLPVSGMASPGAVILPALTLGLGFSALLLRMTRACMLEILTEDFVRTAYAKGLSQRQVILGHVLRAAWLPLLTVLGMQLGGLLAGTVVTETVFAWDGIGRLLVESIEKRDYSVTQACVGLIAIVYVTINYATDMLCAWLDPRFAR